MRGLAIIPGIGNSGEAHWQTQWERKLPDTKRLSVTDWNQPDMDNWVTALDRLVAGFPQPPLLVAHSLGCLLVAHWAGRAAVAGALLVAPPDPTGPTFPLEAAAFGPIPQRALPFPAIVVASSNDPYGSLTHAEDVAKAWGADLVLAGALGHINGATNLGDWETGQNLLRRLG
ncbi:alpha/beta hydrolase [Niveispirillum sp.]|uniref:RBBP9/YdeN family alpha/beta hydrolase n=1 Tax=Niveispirillum sp. TaxID=1917217 RepID=UPI001B7CC351|nr:alpha/beta hydrolase [Niveispirillum sp.]MBP7337751.1 alpha/beta hydrolase [Niveispirillum sp.]